MRFLKQTARLARARKKTFQTIVNTSLILALLLSIMPVATLAAAGEHSPTSTTANCDIPPEGRDNRLFLPMVAGVQSLMARGRAFASTTPLDAPRALGYEVGKTYRYEWQLVINTSSSARDSQGTLDEGSGKSVFHGFADVAILGMETNGAYRGQISLHQPFICSSQEEGESVVEDAELFAALATPMQFKQASSGEVLEVSHPEDAPILATNIQKGILNALQVSLRADEDSYTVEENGGQGVYNAAYALSEQGNDLRVTKTFNQDSFEALISSGENGSLQMQTRVDLVLGSGSGVFTSVNVTEGVISSDETEDPASTDGGGIDGVAAWSKVATAGSLDLVSTKDTPASAASLPDAVYVTGGLGAILPESIPNEEGIDLEAVDLDAELAALEAEPDNPELSRRILQLLDADDRGTVLAKVGERLQANVGDEDIAAAYIDVLGQYGTEQAQNVLNGVLGSSVASVQSMFSVTFSEQAREQALINVSTLKSPTEATLQTLENMSEASLSAFSMASTSALSEMAVTVLGAAADNVRDENPQRAAQIVANLNNSIPEMSAAQADPDQIGLILDAIGNAGDSSSLAVLGDFVADENLEVRIAALDGLRKIPDDEAEELLLGALADNEEEDSVRELVAAVLSDRDLSEEAAAALEEYEEIAATARPGMYQLRWNRHLGGGSAGVNLPGRLIVSSPPRTTSLYLYADQQANAHIWSFRYQLARAQLLSRRQGNSQFFGAYLGIANNRIRRSYQRLLACTYSRNARLYRGSLTIFSFNYRIPIYWVVSVNLSVRATGYFDLTFRYNHNLCNLNNASLVGTITPYVRANASASASVDVTVARGGATLTAALMRTSIPTTLSAAYNGSNLRFCTDVRVHTQALSGRLFAWADVRAPRWGIPPWHWKRVLTKNLWTFSTPTRTYNLLVRCY